MIQSIEQGLTVVIPALNEQDAIGSTVERCREARQRICRAADLDFVELIVVSDGSTDSTAEIARGFEDVRVIEFEHNRGYGAAIKEGWRQGRGQLLGFLDADGTCDPNYFAEMCRIVKTDSADIVLGSRLGPQSKMPRIRRLGNRFYALLLGLLCGRHVTDTASGMRVVRRETLKHLYPLPDRLHFTPSMSARAMMNHLRVVEIPMRYEERIGNSKLHVIRDGIRFTRTILAGVLCYSPEKMFLMAFTLCLVAAVLLMAAPTEFYLRNGRLEEWMIYRFAVAQLFASVGLLLLFATALANRMAHFSRRRADANAFWPSLIASVLDGPALVVILSGLVAAGGLFLWPGIRQYVTSGTVSLHWSRLLAGASCLFAAAETVIFAVLLQVIRIWRSEESDPEWSADVQLPQPTEAAATSQLN